MRAILTYHSIDDSGSAISVPPAVFASHRRWLMSGGVRVLSVDELLLDTGTEGDAVAITFDDGYRTSALAIESLRDHDLPVTLFVPTAHVGGTNDWDSRSSAGMPRLAILDWDELGRLAGRGVTLGGHSRRHPSLPGLGTTELDEELGGGREDLVNHLGVHATLVAYPYGDVDARVAARARLHYRHAVTTVFRGLSSGDDPWQLPRLDMFYFRAPGSLDTWGTAAFQRRVGWVRARRFMKAMLESVVPLRSRHRKRPHP